MFPNTAVAKLRDAQSVMINAFLRGETQSIFNGTFIDIPTRVGYANLPAVVRAPQFEQLLSQFTVQGFDINRLTVNTSVYGEVVGIQRKDWDNAMALQGTQMMETFSTMGIQAIKNRDELLTAQLEANGNDVFGSAFFATAANVFGTGNTITNTVTGTGTSANNVQADFFSVLGTMGGNRGPDGRKLITAGALNSRVIVMYPSAMEGAMQNAFAAQTLAAGGSNILFNRADLRNNPYFTDANNWYVIFQSGVTPPLVNVHADPSMASNVPMSQTPIEGVTNGSDSLLLSDQYLFQARDEAVMTYGARTSICRVTNT